METQLVFKKKSQNHQIQQIQSITNHSEKTNSTSIHYNWSQCLIHGNNINVRSFAGSSSHNNQLYVYGGLQIYGGILSDFYKINLSQNQNTYQWKSVQNLNPQITPGPRAKHALITYQDKLYLLGGITQSTNAYDSNIYVYNIIKKQWQKIIPQGQKLPPLQSFGYCQYQGMIYIIAGYNSETLNMTNSIYSYNIKNNLLKYQFNDAVAKSNINKSINQNIPARRCETACCVSSSNKNNIKQIVTIYIFGGKTEKQKLNDFWIYKLSQNVFYKINDDNDINKPCIRSGHSLTIFQDKIYLFGGLYQVTWQLDDLYMYDLKNQIWNILEMDTTIKKQKKINESKKQQSKIQIATKKKKFSPYYRRKSFIRGKDYQNSNQNKNKDQQFSSELKNNHGDLNEIGSKIQQQRRNHFLNQKYDMLKQFQISQESIDKFLYIQQSTQAILNSLTSIGNLDIKKKNQINSILKSKNNFSTKQNVHSQHEIIQLQSSKPSKFLQPLSNTDRIFKNKKPCARDGHNAILIQNNLFIFGGDRHQMAFNDIYKLCFQDTDQLERQKEIE